MLMIYTYILILIDIDTDNNIYFDVYNDIEWWLDYQNIYAILLDHCKIVLHRKFYDVTISILGLYRRFNLF